jgi:hypothetical protein
MKELILIIISIITSNIFSQTYESNYIIIKTTPFIQY